MRKLIVKSLNERSHLPVNYDFNLPFVETINAEYGLNIQLT